MGSPRKLRDRKDHGVGTSWAPLRRLLVPSRVWVEGPPLVSTSTEAPSPSLAHCPVQVLPWCVSDTPGAQQLCPLWPTVSWVGPLWALGSVPGVHLRSGLTLASDTKQTGPYTWILTQFITKTHFHWRGGFAATWNRQNISHLPSGKHGPLQPCLTVLKPETRGLSPLQRPQPGPPGPNPAPHISVILSRHPGIRSVPTMPRWCPLRALNVPQAVPSKNSELNQVSSPQSVFALEPNHRLLLILLTT